MGQNNIGDGTAFEGRGVTIGYRTTVGANCLFSGPVEVGPYCQFGSAVGVFGANHPTSLMTTYLNQKLMGGIVGESQALESVTVGCGVWVGHGAVILPGVEVGNGAVIAAGAIVTRDVEPYMIVAGNPARPIRRRIASSAADVIERSRWWTWDDARLADARPAFLLDLSEDASARTLAQALGVELPNE